MTEKKDLAIVMCPPYQEYKEQPKDQSHSELFDCPKCKGKMWMSEKKKGVLRFASVLGMEILLACYDCIAKLAKSNPEYFIDSERVDI
jgi:uncharacterized protein YbaR (Trm112 family)